MKLSAVYRSSKRANTYLYLAKRDDFESVPEALMKQFGRPQFVMLIALEKHPKVAGIDRQDFIQKLSEHGFYLQLPPKEKSWLSEYRESIGLSGDVPAKPSYSSDSLPRK